MDIVVAPTRSYIDYTLVLMTSVYMSQPEGTEITFWIANSDFLPEDEKRIEEFAAGYNHAVKFVPVDKQMFEPLFEKSYSDQLLRWSTNCFIPLMLHKLLPESLKRVLFLDIDISVVGDITEFYALDFEGRTLIASQNSYSYSISNEPDKPLDKFLYYDKVDLAVAERGNLFCSGVVLYNLEKMRYDNIDLNFYLKTVPDWSRVTLLDQSVLNIAFGSSAKLLTTCKYNYRLAYSAKGYFDLNNERFNDTRKYKFIPVQGLKIIHFCGLFPIFTKPWDYCFSSSSEIDSYEKSFLGLIPECVDHFKIWWNFAEKTPVYDALYQAAYIRTAALKQMKKVMLDTNLEFLNQMGLETLRVPSWRNLNSIYRNDDLNRFTKPKVYRCKDGELKDTIKNLPEGFTQSCGFRLTVKHICVNAVMSEMTPVIQTLEPDSPDASIYRRHCARPRTQIWGPWYKVATSSDLAALEQRILKLEQLAENKAGNGDDQILSLKLELSKAESALTREREERNRLETELEKCKSSEAQLNSDLKELKRSTSLKIGRFITFIPRKIVSLFRKG